MFRYLLLAALAVAAIVPAHARADEPNPVLHKLFADEWERGLRESPESASYNGDPRFNDRWTDFSLEAISRREAADRAALDALHRIDRDGLSAADQLHYDTFEWSLQRSIERQKFREYQQPVSHQGGPQTADGIAEVLPFATLKDYQDWLQRLQALPVAIDQVIVLMREGVKAGNLPPRVLMQRVPAQIAAQVVQDPMASAFYKPLLKFPDGIAEADRTRLQADARRIIATAVVPAYRKFQAFFNDEYLPKARDSIAATGLPDGKAYYDFLARYYTTTDLGAGQIHATGLAEVARIRAEMEKVKARTGFKGSLAEFFTYLRTDARFFHKTPDEL
ncbi:MAG: DUF885 domain-containing protein, partial [Lysobacteraceae bacterium]